MITDEMIHGSLPRSGGARPQRQFRAVRRVRRPHQGPSPLHQREQQGWGEWDASARLFEEIRMRCREAGETYRPPWPTRIEDDTPIVPRAVAEQVCEEASLWLGEPFPHEWVAELAERANVVYQHNARFRQLLRKPGNAGNKWLAAFMRHWLSALLASRRPDLHQRLPGSYAAGQDLPSAKPPLDTRPPRPWPLWFDGSRDKATPMLPQSLLNATLKLPQSPERARTDRGVGYCASRAWMAWRSWRSMEWCLSGARTLLPVSSRT